MSNAEALLARLDQNIGDAEALLGQLQSGGAESPPVAQQAAPSEEAPSEEAPNEEAPALPTTIEVPMKKGKGYGYVARQINQQMSVFPDWDPIKGKEIRGRMGGQMLWHKSYTFQTEELMGSGFLDGGVTGKALKKAMQAGTAWRTGGREKYLAKKAAEKAAEEKDAAEAKAEAEAKAAAEKKADEEAYIAEDAAKQKAWEKENAVGQTMADPAVLEAAAEADRKKAAEAKEKEKMVKKLWTMHKRSEAIRKAANESASFYIKTDYPDSEKQERIVKQMEDTAEGAGTLRTDIMTSLSGLYEAKNCIRSDLSAADIRAILYKHQETIIGLEIDLTGDKAKSAPNTSISGAFKETAVATTVATISAANGVVSELPVVGEIYEREFGGEFKKDLKRDATGILDKESAHHAVDSGDVIGRAATTVVTLANPTAAIVVTDSVFYGTVEAVTGEDVATGRELSDGERALGAVGALASGTGALARADSAAKINTAVAAMEGTKAAPTLISQVANATSIAKKTADVADSTTAAVTGRRLFKPEEKLTTTGRALHAVNAVAGTAGVVTSNTDSGRAHKLAHTRSTGMTVADGLSSGVKTAKAVDKGVTAATGYSPLKETEVESKDRVAAGVGLATSGVGKTKTTIDGIETDIKAGVQDAFSDLAKEEAARTGAKSP